MMSPMPADIKAVLSNLEQNLDTACAQLSDNLPAIENPSFNRDTFWKNLISATEVISHEATKLCMMFRDPPFPSKEVTQDLADNIERTCLSFVAVYFTLPKTQGFYFHREIHQYVLSVLKKMKDLVATAREDRSSLLLRTGQMWKKCEYASGLPKDNRIAVMFLCMNQFGTVEDASAELMDAIENAQNPEEGDDGQITPQMRNLTITDTRWSEADKQVLLPCSGLVKAVKACLKKTLNTVTTNGNGEDVHGIRELDGVAEIIKSSSEMIDDLVLSLYAPMNHSVVREKATEVRDQFKRLLSYIKECQLCSEADKEWISFLEKALDHNWVKITDLLLVD